jgi:hypothetical protein
VTALLKPKPRAQSQQWKQGLDDGCTQHSPTTRGNQNYTGPEHASATKQNQSLCDHDVASAVKQSEACQNASCQEEIVKALIEREQTLCLCVFRCEGTKPLVHAWPHEPQALHTENQDV